MSYCRFENTLADMQDCVHAIENGLDVEELSEYEIRALRSFSATAKQITLYESRILNVILEFEEINK